MMLFRPFAVTIRSFILAIAAAGAVTQPDMKQKFIDTGVEVVAGWPGEFETAIAYEITTSGPIIKQAGVRH